jgi:hypothetical protein
MKDVGIWAVVCGSRGWRAEQAESAEGASTRLSELPLRLFCSDVLLAWGPEGILFCQIK